jgi:serine phosphatase RsbU (regulator of sigma subunit)
MDRLTNVLVQNRDRPSRGIGESISRAISDFTKGEKRQDDITIIVLRVAPREGTEAGADPWSNAIP